MIQLILHLLGDYVLQSDWMAQNKTKSTWAAFCHATVYSIPFAFISSPLALFVIWSTHLLIDRFRLARYVVYVKNLILDPMFFASDKEIIDHHDEYKEHCRKFSWENCKVTGYPSESPAWLSVWLLIAADNTMHLVINYASIAYL